MSNFSILKEINILKKIEDDIIKKISDIGILKSYKKDELLFVEGEELDKIYLICEGRVLVSKYSQDGDEKIIYILQREEFINEMSLDNRKTSSSVRVIEDCKLLSFNNKDIMELMKADFNFNLLIINSLSNKLRKSFRQIRNLGLKKLNSRIASKLWKLCRDYGENNMDGIEIKMNITQTQLASMVGTSRECIGRFFKQLDKEAVLKYKNQRIVILDFEKFEAYIK